MKRMLSVFTIAAAAAAGLIMAGCQMDSGDPPPRPDPIVVAIGGLEYHEGSYASLFLLNAEGAAVASSAPAQIPSGGSVEMALLDAQEAPFAASGSFTLMLVISNDEDGEDVVWFGSAEKPIAGGDVAMDLDESFDEPEPSAPGTSDDYRALPADIASLEARLSWLRRNARSGNTYLITASAGEYLAPQALSFFGRSDVSIILRGSSAPVIALSRNGSLFTIGAGVSLTLESIALQGRGANSASLVNVGEGGTLIMEDGSKIAGNAAPHGGGVVVNGTFEMRGGEIYGNAASSSVWSQGGGVAVFGGTFEMRGGKIHGNTALRQGGGVHVGPYGAFVMSGDAKIYGNIVTADEIGGGGVLLYGTFEMKGGTISGNSACRGGGVRIGGNGTFAMSCGEISGNTASVGSGGGVLFSGAAFSMSGGAIIYGNTTANMGGGVQLWSGVFTMTGNGKIHGNDAARFGGGVAMSSSAHFIMDGYAEIRGNRADDIGGGVVIFDTGTFYMKSGTISGNVSARPHWGPGGVWIYNSGRFYMGGGTIYGTGNDVYEGLRNIGSHSLYVGGNGSASFGTFDSDGIFSPAYPYANLPNSANTIRVENGALAAP